MRNNINKTRRLLRLGSWLMASFLMSGFLSTANAVVFFKDDFERTSLNKTTGLANGQTQDAVAPSQWDYFKTTLKYRLTGLMALMLTADGIGWNWIPRLTRPCRQK
jgi:hypothetical protein